MYIGIRHKHLNDKHYDDVDNKCNAHEEEPPSRAIVGNHSQNETNHSHRLEEVEFTVIVHAGNNTILASYPCRPPQSLAVHMKSRLLSLFILQAWGGLVYKAIYHILGHTYA